MYSACALHCVPFHSASYLSQLRFVLDKIGPTAEGMDSGRMPSCLLILVLGLWCMWCMSGENGAFVPFSVPCGPGSGARQHSCILRRVRENRVRFQGRKEAAARKQQVRHKKGASIQDFLGKLTRASHEGRLRDAENIFAALLSLEGGFEPNAMTINKLILAAANGGDIKAAQNWFERLEKFDLQPDVACFTSVISAGAKYGRVPFAEKWFDKMLSQHIAPTVAAYGAVIHAASNAGDLDAAEAWFERMRRGGSSPTRSFSTQPLC